MKEAYQLGIVGYKLTTLSFILINTVKLYVKCVYPYDLNQYKKLSLEGGK